jgi:hypothetical protein
VAAKFRERLAVTKGTTQKFHGERFYLRKLMSRSLGNNIR